MFPRLQLYKKKLARNNFGQVFKHRRHGTPMPNNVKCIQVGQLVHDFMCTQVEPIPVYNMTAYLLQHVKTKTEYCHLERDDTNNVFSIAFRTTPQESMGTPHILEHTVLCGSEKYPVRDPFFKMLNRSLATFMNAMTGPDYTIYPFSTQNEVDYQNLQRVYLDAVFKPKLLRLDFLQEGWRLEHEKLNDSTSPLTFKGVVYNEMKGAFSETNSLLGQKFLNTILPLGTYGHVYGGDPLQIPNLTHDFLKQFHATHYHPSNARIYSYGNFPLENNLKLLNEEYLSHYSYLDPSITEVARQKRWTEPKHVNIKCRYDKYGSPIEKQNQISVGYVMTDITDVYETFLMSALAELMIIGPNSAFYKSLIEKNISGGYNTLTGYDNQIRDTLFVVGLRDVKKCNYQEVEDIIQRTLETIHSKGFDKDHIESVLHGFELEIKHQLPRFGLNVILNLIPTWTHNGSILTALKVDKLLEKLKFNLMDPSYVKKIIEKYFISNKHKLTMTVEPDNKYDDIFNEKESKILKEKIKALNDEEKKQIFAEGLQLAEAQKKEQDLSLLPCLKLHEITLSKTAPPLKHAVYGTIPVQLCEANTNGVSYFKAVLGTESLSHDERKLLPFFTSILTKFDTKSYDYRSFDKTTSRYTSGFSATTHIAEHIGTTDQYEEGILIGSHCLDENLPKMLDLWEEIFAIPNFNNLDRMKMLLTNYCSSLSNGVIDSGHVYAMQAAKSLVSSVNQCRENLSGMHHVIEMQKIIKDCSVEEVQRVTQKLAQQILKGTNCRAAFHYCDSNKNSLETIEEFAKKLCRKSESNLDVNTINWVDSKQLPETNKSLHISMNIPVNFCAKAIPTVRYTHADYPKLKVLTKLLTSLYLHPIVREQNGAYGAGAVVGYEGLLEFYSYRDPNSLLTLNVFDQSSDWMLNNKSKVTEQNLFEAKLAILQEMDKPSPEFMKGIDLFMFGLSYDIWKTQRERVLAVTAEDLLEMAQKYLKPDSWAGKCVIGKSIVGENLEKEKETWLQITGPCE